MSKRTNNTQLPQIKELEDILKKEDKRNPAKCKKKLHYPNFDFAQEWLDFLNIKSEIFSIDWTWRKILSESIRLKLEVVNRTLSIGPEKRKMFERITTYLGEEDFPEKSDLIFVFGSKSFTRIDTAIDLWKKRFAPKIFITGGHPHYEIGESEAEIFKKHAVEKGVPSESVLIESESITVADNVRRSLNLFDERRIKYNRMVIVSSWFALRRSWSFMMKYIPENNIVFRIASGVDPNGYFTKDGWWKNESGISVVFNEFVKMKIGVTLNTC